MLARYLDTDGAGDGTRIMQLVREARQVVTTVNRDPNTFHAGSISTEQCGRPKLNNTSKQLQFLLERRFNSLQIAALLGVSHATNNVALGEQIQRALSCVLLGFV